MDTTNYEQHHDRFLISTDRSRIDSTAVHDYLSNRSYWAHGIPREIVERSIIGSLPFGVYDGERQIGFARVISDFATYAYIADVYILEEYRGHGLGKWLMRCVMAHPDLQGLRRFHLITADAHGLYRKSGFVELSQPQNHLEIRRQNIYAAPNVSDQPATENER